MKPNILVFMTDQQHAETIGKHGLCRTPRLNELMEAGVTFSHAFTSCPMCTPARATALTGLHPHQHRVIFNAHSKMKFHTELDEDVETIGGVLGQAGYRTAYAGKWHIGDKSPLGNGFAEMVEAAAASPSTEATIANPVAIRDRSGEHVLAGTADFVPEVFRIASQVNDWLERRQNDEQPFFLYVSCAEPHVPWIVPEPYASMYDPAHIGEWANYRDDYRDKPLTFSKHYTHINFCRIRNDWPTMARALSHYFGCVTMVDDAFGTILDKLENTGKLDNTIVIFTSDHGELMGRHGLVGKNELALDDIIRIPLVVYWKGHVRAGVCDQLVTIGDLFNTMVQLAGAEQRSDLDSVSFVPCLTGTPYEARQEVVVEHHGTVNMNTVRAIRTKRYKYVYRAHETDEFYDLGTDSLELHNRISDPSCRDDIGNMRGNLLRWAERTGDYALQGMELAFANPDSAEFREGR